MSRAVRIGVRRRGTGAPLTLMDILNAPELAVLDVLGHAVHVANAALIAQHPQLLGDEQGRVRHDGDPAAQRAAEVIDCAFALSRAVRRYRAELAKASTLRDDDFPF
ncbi:MAG: hypothetical protein M3O36_00505 [Myxococcota bacterium]|nr:hypothetical protein [Myxococcota bacterium]